jgi:heat shock protein HtpX
LTTVPRPTFYQLQAKHRARSATIFALLIGYYFLGFLVLASFAKLLLYFYLLRPLFSGPLLSGSAVLRILGIALAAAVLHWLACVAGGVSRILRSLGAQALDTRDRYHQRLRDVVDEIRISAGNPVVDPVVVPSVAVNAFTVGDTRGRLVIGVTEGLLARLTRPQLQAVVAHEMGHALTGDHIVTTVSSSLFGVFAQLLTLAESRAGEERTAASIFVPILWLLTLGSYTLKLAVSRQREYLADAMAVQFTRDPLTLAEALYVISRNWKGMGLVHSGLEAIFIVHPTEGSLGEKSGPWAELFSTHPPVNRRINLLLLQANAGLSGIEERSAQPGVVPARWHVWVDGAWSEPYTLDEIAVLPTLSPDLWIAPEGAPRACQARDEKDLAALLRSGSGDATVSEPACPRCRIPLKERDYEGCAIHQCLSCEGNLVEEPKLPRIFARREVGFTPPQRKWMSAWETRFRNRPAVARPSLQDLLPCPGCGARMTRGFYSYRYFILIDRCHHCGYAWFDAGELELLQMLVEAKTAGTRRTGDLGLRLG